jgi:hypothetical protein
VALILATPFILAGPHVAWAVGPLWNKPDWSLVIEDVFGRIRVQSALMAAGVFVGALLMLLWPARGRRRKVVEEGTVKENSKSETRNPNQ